MSPIPNRLEVRALDKAYATGPLVLHDLTFDVREGEFLSIVGPSGAGKTTLLRCLSGLMPATSGSVLLDGKPLAGPHEKMSVVFQDYSRSLLRWMTVEANVALALQPRGVAKREARERARAALASVGLAGSETKHPVQLSGGMQQRAAIARALVTEPEVLVMDEPFASIDAQTRLELEDLTLRLQRESGVTVVLVTHDIDEAVYLSDRIVVLSRDPATVEEIVAVDLGTTRDQLATREDPRFGELRSHVLGLIRDIQARAARAKSA